MSDSSDPRAHVSDLLNGFSTAMFVTPGLYGAAQAQPMRIAHREDGVHLWFFTSNRSELASRIEQNDEVLLIFQKENAAYLSLRGTALLLEDRDRIRQFWKEPYRVWFPGGPDDAEIVLIAVTAEGAEYWDNRGTNRIEYLWEAAKAYVSGSRPNTGGPEQYAQTEL
jgi:general stress protein 26